MYTKRNYRLEKLPPLLHRSAAAVFLFGPIQAHSGLNSIVPACRENLTSTSVK